MIIFPLRDRVFPVRDGGSPGSSRFGTSGKADTFAWPVSAPAKAQPRTRLQPLR